MRFLLFASFGLCSIVACNVQENAPTADDELVGGTPAAEGQYPSTLLVRGNCTVSKVGPRHILSAAHCVVDEPNQKLRSDFQPNAKIYVTRSLEADSHGPPADSGFVQVTIKDTYVHGIYKEENVGSSIRVLQASAAPDVAIIELTEESAALLADVPEAQIDLTPVAVGSPVVIMGYGCEKGVNGPKDYTKQRLKVQATKTLGIDSQMHEGSYVNDRGAEYAKLLEQQYIFTPGNGTQQEEASLCPGDSGGPVYRAESNGQTIVGVNAYYTFKPRDVDPDAISVTNWHTRLDGSSRFDIGAWLTALGAKTTGGKASTHYEACVASPSTGRYTCGAIKKHVAAAGGESHFGTPTTEARYEPSADGKWIWTQRFEGKKVTVAADDEISVESVGLQDACIRAVDGSYCGPALGDRDANALYECKAGTIESRVLCATGCQSMPPGEPDVCAGPRTVDPCKNASLGDGRYCAHGLGSNDRKSLLQCKDGATFGRIECPNGCKGMPNGTPDECAP